MDAVAIIVSVLSAAVAVGTCLMISAEGGVLGENAGILNLGFEGIMLMGAVSGFLTVQHTASLTAAVLAAMLAGAAMALIHAFLSVTLGASQVVSGLSITILGTGLSAFMGTNRIGEVPLASFSKLAIPFLSDIPVLGPAFFHQNIVVYFGYLLAPALWFFLKKTRYGMQIRAIGHNPAAADAAGLNVAATRYICTVISGMLTGLSGVYLSLGYNSSWMENMTGGKGWIAVALVIFSAWDPLKVPLGAYMFGGITVIGLRLQAFGIRIPTSLFDSLPYLATIVVLILTTGNFRKKISHVPEALGVPYRREAR